jgi:murein DD-endopeptidase MepM/ murein hydrolase activator NlpD
VYAPVAGTVLRASDGMPERQWIHPARELFHMARNAFTFTPEKLGSILGNHVILETPSGVLAAFAHFTPGSVGVEEGQTVNLGDVLGRVGHTGNSTSPHLHFQLMDAADPLLAKGIPCAFREYEVLRDAAWERVERGIPGRRERVRYPIGGGLRD